MVKISHLEIAEVVLVNCNSVNNDYQHDSSVSYKIVPNKFFGQLLDISRKNFVFLTTLIQSFHILKYDFLTKILNR